MSTFEKAVDHTLSVEGGFVDDPDDRGGATNKGITYRTFKEWAKEALDVEPTIDNLKALSRDDAIKIYKAGYWDRIKLDRIAAIDAGVALELFDTGVNTGTATAVEFLQRLLNVLNNRGADYADIEVDGGVGDITVGALQAFADRRGQEGLDVLVTALNCLQGAHYVELAERKPKQEKFLYGWLRHRVER